MNHIGRTKAMLGSYQNYKYNGKELQETGMYDYGARMYMADIGRWGVVDPRSQYTHEVYSYVWNNPISFADPTGMEGELATCPTCPNTPQFQPYINDPNNVYVYEPDTNTAIKEIQIQEVTLTGTAKSSNSGPRSLAMAALLVSQADSPVPGPADVVAAAMLIGAGVWWTYNQFAPPSTGYTTIADPGAGYRSMNTEDSAEEDKDVNGADVPKSKREMAMVNLLDQKEHNRKKRKMETMVPESIIKRQNTKEVLEDLQDKLMKMDKLEKLEIKEEKRAIEIENDINKLWSNIF